MNYWDLYKKAKAEFEAGKILEAVGTLYDLYELKVFDNDYLNKGIIWLFIRILFKIDKNNAQTAEDILLMARSYRFVRPDEAYSVLLKAALRHKDYTDISGFIKWWRLKNLRKEDFLPEEIERPSPKGSQHDRHIVPKNKNRGEKSSSPKGKKIKLPALAERAYMAVAGALLSQKKPNLELIKAFSVQLSDFSARNPQFSWLPYYHARLVLVSGESRKEILEKILPFVRHKRADFWAWELMARLYKHEPDMQLACYCKALLCRAKEDFLVKLRERFAVFLLGANFLAEAKCEALAVIATKERNGHRIPAQIEQMRTGNWWKICEARRNNTKFYKQHAPAAERLLYPDDNFRTAVVQHVNLEKRIVNFIVSKTEKGFFFYGKCADLRAGQCLEIYVKPKGDKGLYSLKKLRKTKKTANAEVYKEVEGQLLRKQGKWFVNNEFVPGFIVKQAEAEMGDLVRIKAFLSFNRQKNKDFWKISELKKV